MLYEDAENALNAAGELTSGEPEPVDVFLFYGGHNALKEALEKHHDRLLIKITLWNISNIAAGTKNQIMALLNVEGMWDKCLEMMHNEDRILRREALMILFNILTCTEDINTKA